MATADELLSAELADDVLIVDLESRIINIPKTVTTIGVESDDDVLLLHFSMPRNFCGTDLSTFGININYLNAKGGGDLYEVKNPVISDNEITFDWLVGRNATIYKGNVNFNVCLKYTENGEVLREINTTVATLPVLKGLETGEAVVLEYADVLEQWKSELFGSGDTITADIQSAGAEVLSNIESSVNTYVSEHVDELTGPKGDIGTVFVPTVDDDGNISWTNDGGLINPETKNIKGPTGPAFTYDMFTAEQLKALTGSQGETGATFTPTVDSNGYISWSNDKGLTNPVTRLIMGPTGPAFTYDMFTAEQLEEITGPQGVSITSISRTSGNGAAGTVDTYTIYMSNGSTSTFQVRNGTNGTGAGDMEKSVYDRNNRNTDVFEYIDGKIGDIDSILDSINGENS